MSKKPGFSILTIAALGLGSVAAASAVSKKGTPLAFTFFPEPPATGTPEFFRWLAPVARHVQRRTGIPASVTLAQALLESGRGQSQLSSKYKNLYGMKWGSCTSRLATGTVDLKTGEVVHGAPVTITAAFATYASYYASTLQHALLFYCARVYQPALAYRGNALEFFALHIPLLRHGPQLLRQDRRVDRQL